MEKASALLTFLTKGAARLAGVLLVVLIVVQLGNVLARYLFGISSVLSQELAVYLNASAILLACGWSLAKNRHVRIDVLSFQFDEGLKLRRDVICFLVLGLPLLTVLLWLSVPYVLSAWAVLEGSAEISGLPGVFLIKTLLPVFLILLLIGGILALTHTADRTNER